MKLKNGSELVIRRAARKDARQLIDYLEIVRSESDYLLATPNDPTPTLEQEEKFIDNFNSSKTSVFLVGFIGDVLVCAGSISGNSKERIAHHGNVAMSVLKDYWGMGVGTALMHALVDFAKHTAKLEILHLGVNADNMRGINLYKRVGFEEIGRFPKYFKINDRYYDEILMNLCL